MLAKVTLYLLLALYVVLLSSVPAFPESDSSCGKTKGFFMGKVSQIIDGDTIVVITADDQRVKVRLAFIDAPESRQRFGSDAVGAVAAKCLHELVSVRCVGKDLYGRILGEVFIAFEEHHPSINEQLVEEGMAWYYRAGTRCKKYEQLERDAADTKCGLWEDSEPVPPWVYRKFQKKIKRPPQQTYRDENQVVT